MNVYINAATAISDNESIPGKYARDLRRADPFISSGVIAVHNLLNSVEDTGYSLPDNCGLYLASGFGPMETNFDVLDQVIGKEQTSPTLFSHSVFNAAAGYLARIFKLHGAALTITDFAFPFFQALQQAIIAIHSGQLSTCLVLQIETYSVLLQDARKVSSSDNDEPWKSGGCAFLLSAEPLYSQNFKITDFKIDTLSSSATHYLVTQEKVAINDTIVNLTSPLEGVMKLAQTLNTKPSDKISFTLRAKYGSVLLETDRV